MSSDTDRTADCNDSEGGLTPKQRVEATNPRVLDPCIATIHDLDTLQECVAYENQHKQRIPILEMLARRAEELRKESGLGEHPGASGVVRPSERGGSKQK